MRSLTLVVGMVAGAVVGLTAAISWGVAERVKELNPQVDPLFPFTLYFGFLAVGLMIGFFLGRHFFLGRGELPEPEGYPFPAAPREVQVALRRMRALVGGGEE
ncbi:MAG: hypothetical protein QXL98_03290 [Thermofilaceae archaeon]